MRDRGQNAPRMPQALVASAADGQVNRLLRSLPESEYALLLPHLEPVELAAMEVLNEPGQSLDHVYFAETAVISMLRRMRDGTVIESGMVGRDGVAGLAAIQGIAWSAATIVAAVPGSCLRMPAPAIREVLAQAPTLAGRTLRYAHAFMDQLGQTIACNGLHSIEQRCTRWLLAAHDRAGQDDFHLTHEVLAQMLGVRRAGVTMAALVLQREQLIAYSRGRITVVNRAGLEASACECHAVTRQRAEALMSMMPDAVPGA